MELKWSQEKLKTMLMHNSGVTKIEYYGKLWYFLEWSITPLGITPSWNRLNTSRAPHDKRALVPVVQTLDSASHRINLYPVGNTYRLDSDLSGGYLYPVCLKLLIMRSQLL